MANTKITVANMAANSIDSDQYVDGSIDTAHIADDAITSAKLDTNIAIAGTLGVTGATTITKTGTNASPHIKLTESGDTREFNIYNDGSGNGRLVLADTDDTPDTEIVLADNGILQFKTANTERFNIGSGGDISFYEDTGTTAKLFWDASAESLGIGTSSPSAKLEINGDINIGTNAILSNGTLTVSAGSGAGYSTQISTAYSFPYVNTQIDAIAAASYSGQILFRTSSGGGSVSERMRIDSSGDVLIGQTSQTGYTFAQKLVVGDGDNNDGITIQSGSTHQGNLAFNHSDGTTAHGRISYQHGTNYMQFFVNNSEKIKINSTGQVLVNPLGVSTPSFAFTNDTNTGMTRPTSDTLQFVCGGTVRLRVSGDGLLFNSDTAAANALNDYEEGTYNATISCASGSITLYTSYTALRYTKIGRQVHVHGKLALQAVSSPSGATNLNLPFASANDTNRSGVANNIMTGFFNGSAVTDGIYPIYGNIEEASSNCRLFIMQPPASNNLGDNHVAAGSDIHVNFTYTTD